MQQMKYSGVEWIGNIPEGWNVERLQWHLYEINDKNNPIKSTEVLSLSNKKGVIPYEEKGAQGNISKENYAEYHLAYKDTIVANSMNILIGSVGYSNYFGCVSPVYYVFKEREGTCLRFINYIMQTVPFQKELRKYANGILEIRMRVSVDDIFKRKIALPLFNKQEKIANFLDVKCEEIDSLISNIQKEIELLQDYKKSIITEGVTKGLNKNIKLKNSGIEWAKQIPEHWGITRIKYNLSRKTVRNPGDAIVLSLYREYGVIPKDSRDDNHNVTSEDISKYLFVKRGQLVINKMKAWQGSMAISNYEGIVSPAYYVYDFKSDNLCKGYLYYLLKNPLYIEEFRRLSGGIREGQWDLPAEEFENLEILLPPIQEQKEITEYLDKKCKEIDSIIKDKNKQLDILAEYKKSIIYEYVTGKKEVI